MNSASMIIKERGALARNRTSLVTDKESIHAAQPTLRTSGAASCAVLVERIGPYHLSRLNAIAGRLPTFALEHFGMDSTYAWEKVSDAADFQRLTLLEHSKPGMRRDRALVAAVSETLTRVAPAVVAIPGWYSKGALAALNWCLQTGTPAVVLSASSEIGKQRTSWKEALKRRIVRLFSAGVGGGTPQADYLARLGIPRSNVFLGYDVVDNGYFTQGADDARRDTVDLRQSLGLPERYFLCICRFIEEKNLPLLLEAYAAYRRHAGAPAWKLVLVGDGPLKPKLLKLRDEFGLTEDLLLPGFKQYQELPAYYGLASAFVLPSLSETWGLVTNEAMAAGLPVIISNHCGCATDLVRDGENGFTFDPRDIVGLTSLLTKLASPETNLAAMGKSSREIIARWTPETFALSLQRAAEMAIAARPPVPKQFDRFLLWLMINR